MTLHETGITTRFFRKVERTPYGLILSAAILLHDRARNLEVLRLVRRTGHIERLPLAPGISAHGVAALLEAHGVPTAIS